MHNTTGGWVGGCAIVASTYIFDVTAKGGGTCFFPGSHTAVGDVFEDEPRQFITGEFARSFGYGDGYAHNLFQYGGSGDHLIATMKAGSVCFAHGYMVHTTTPNLNRDTIRLGTSQSAKPLRPLLRRFAAHL
jgi:ectoine hydroxylase-related dioxygenase (phytanoyl-CoA dioxygenase family)|eukprot:COSAG03_NODE_1693_length_3639_cov_8.547458_5_plen_132_part_00